MHNHKSESTFTIPASHLISSLQMVLINSISCTAFSILLFGLFDNNLTIIYGCFLFLPLTPFYIFEPPQRIRHVFWFSFLPDIALNTSIIVSYAVFVFCSAELSHLFLQVAILLLWVSFVLFLLSRIYYFFRSRITNKVRYLIDLSLTYFSFVKSGFFSTSAHFII